jgi:hypothetical protein
VFGSQDVGGTLADDNTGRLGITCGHARHDGPVGDPQPFYSIHFQRHDFSVLNSASSVDLDQSSGSGPVSRIRPRLFGCRRPPNRFQPHSGGLNRTALALIDVGAGAG